MNLLLKQSQRQQYIFDNLPKWQVNQEYTILSFALKASRQIVGCKYQEDPFLL